MSVPKKASVKKRTRLPADVRKEQVLDIAASVFAEKGYRRASVADVVEKAGVGRGTFYLYFKSKRDVFLELIESYFSNFAALLKENHGHLKAAVGGGGNLLEIWKDNISRILEYHRDHTDITAVVYREALGRDEDFSERVDQLSRLARRQLLQEFTLLQENGFIRPVDLEVVTTMVLGSSIYLIMEHVMKGRRRNLEDLAGELIEYHLRALVPRETELDGKGENRKHLVKAKGKRGG